MARQEQEPAGTDVKEVGPGVLRMQLPISMPGLGHVNMYALEDERGWAIVDPGLPGPATWKGIQERFKDAGIKNRDVHSVLVTHSHPDHFGSAGRLADEAGGVDIVTHAAFRMWMVDHSKHDCHANACDEDNPYGEDVDVDPEDLAHRDQHQSSGPRFGGPTPWGGKDFKPPLSRRIMYKAMQSKMRRRFAPPTPTVKLRNGDVIKLAGREWFAVHTPGHTLDHLCLHDPEAGLLLSGDHVLPSITPHISGMYGGRDPLKLFVDSLDKVAALDVKTVLPAHGHPFEDLPGRVESIKEHHHERMDTLRQASAAMGPATVEQLMQQIFKQRSWGSMAESETYAHLEHLRIAGEAECYEESGVLLYKIS